MTYANFKTMVLSYMNRSSAVLTSGSLDYVLLAMNDARRAAQREYTFNLLRTTAFANCSLAPVSLLTDFDTDDTAGTLRVVKQIDAVYEYSTASVSGTTRYYRLNKVPFFRQSVFEQELAISPTYAGGVRNNPVPGSLQAAKQFIYQQGTNVHHSTLSTPAWFMFDVIYWDADHAGGAVEDVWLTYFVDWLKWATILQLNQYLKDTERFPVDAQFVAQLWEGVKQFDAQQGASTDSISLN